MSRKLAGAEREKMILKKAGNFGRKMIPFLEKKLKRKTGICVTTLRFTYNKLHSRIYHA